MIDLRPPISQGRPCMEGIRLSSPNFSPQFFKTLEVKHRGRTAHNLQSHSPLRAISKCSLKANSSAFSRRYSVLLERPFCSNATQDEHKFLLHQFRSNHMRFQSTSAESLSHELFVSTHNNEAREFISDGAEDLQASPKTFKNRFFNFLRLGSVFDSAAESFFKSEIRRRLFITALLIVISRVGYFIPLPGFDRRLIPENYLSFVSGAVDELGDSASELKLSLFQLGISPQIAASTAEWWVNYGTETPNLQDFAIKILSLTCSASGCERNWSVFEHVLCHIVPSLVKLRKEGLDGNEKIKGYIWWISLAFAIVEGLIVSIYSLQYSIYTASQSAKHVMLTTFLLVCGAMTMTWICDKISDSGFGQGSSLVICVNILTGYTETLHKMLTQLAGSAVGWWPYVSAVLCVFTVVTMWAVVVTEGCRKIKLQYYGFKLASASREDSPITEVEQYIPFNINPSGMQPVLTTSYLLAFPGILASLLGSGFWAHVKEILNPDTSIGAAPWVYYSIYALFVFLFNIFDIANMPKEIAEYLNKMGARIPNIKPGKATVEYLTKIQASTRFWGGLLLSILATTSTILDRYLRQINEGFAIGFTSVLIIVGSIIELRRSYQAYNVMPSLSKALRRYGV